MVDIAVFLIVLTCVAFAARLLHIHMGLGRDEGRFVQTALRLGLRQVPDLPAVMGRVGALLQPEGGDGAVLWKPGPAFALSVGRREAFLFEWSHPDARFRRAYVVLGPRAPHLLASPRRRFTILEEYEEPTGAIGFPEDPPFSRTFWVWGADPVAIRLFLGPELRRFLLAYRRGWRFHAGPEGAALSRWGRTPPSEWPQMRAILERLAAVVEAAARR